MRISSGGSTNQSASSAANQTSGSQKTQLVDSSGNVITSSANGTKRSIDVNISQSAVNAYAARMNVRQTAATVGGLVVWAMTNPSGSTKSVYLEKINVCTSFDAVTLVSNALIRWSLLRFTGATPTGGTVVNVSEMDNSNPATSVTDIRFLDTGLTFTGSLETPYAVIAVPGVQGSTNPYKFDLQSFVLAPGEGFALTTSSTAAAGAAVVGNVIWSER